MTGRDQVSFDTQHQHESTSVEELMTISYRLKPAVNIDKQGSVFQFQYRGDSFQIELQTKRSLSDLREHLNRILGEPETTNFLESSDIVTKDLIAALRKRSMLTPISKIAPTEDFTSGADAYLNLECDLCKLKFGNEANLHGGNIEELIAQRIATPAVAVGYLLEIGYLLRQVPNELSRAIASANTEITRGIFMDFFDDESRHGEMIFEELCSWIPRDHLLSRRPLPSTLGLLHTYMVFAEKGSLTYATALMRDESQPNDPVGQYDVALYKSLRDYYHVPRNVVDIFEWHANLDRQTSHGSVPELVFGSTPIVSRHELYALKSNLRSLFELHNLLRRDILDTYSGESKNEWSVTWN